MKIENVTTEDIKVYKWVCLECGKVIKSFYPREFEYNIKAHKLKHTIKGKKMKTALKYSREVLREIKKERNDNQNKRGGASS